MLWGGVVWTLEETRLRRGVQHQAEGRCTETQQPLVHSAKRPRAVNSSMSLRFWHGFRSGRVRADGAGAWLWLWLLMGDGQS